MTPFEEMPVGVGDVFATEVAIVQAASDTYDQASFVSSISETISALNEDNPYVGQKVVMDVLQPILFISLEDGTQINKSFNGDPIECVIVGFHPEIHDMGGILAVDLSVELDFSDHQDLSKYAATIPAEMISNVELSNSHHPFGWEERRFHEAYIALDRLRVEYPDADEDDYLNDVVADIEAKSTLMHSEVEVLIANESQVNLRRSEMVPRWAEAEDVESEDNDEVGLSYRGTITGKVIGYEYVWDGEDSVDLQVILTMDPIESISDDPTHRYVFVCCNDISQGRVLSGPYCN